MESIYCRAPQPTNSSQRICNSLDRLGIKFIKIPRTQSQMISQGRNKNECQLLQGGSFLPIPQLALQTLEQKPNNNHFNQNVTLNYHVNQQYSSHEKQRKNINQIKSIQPKKTISMTKIDIESICKYSRQSLSTTRLRPNQYPLLTKLIKIQNISSLINLQKQKISHLNEKEKIDPKVQQNKERNNQFNENHRIQKQHINLFKDVYQIKSTDINQSKDLKIEENVLQQIESNTNSIQSLEYKFQKIVQQKQQANSIYQLQNQENYIPQIEQKHLFQKMMKKVKYQIMKGREVACKSILIKSWLNRQNLQIDNFNELFNDINFQKQYNLYQSSLISQDQLNDLQQFVLVKMQSFLKLAETNSKQQQKQQQINEICFEHILELQNTYNQVEEYFHIKEDQL